MGFHQLKPQEDSFIKIARSVVRILDVFMLCEGRTDVEIFKVIAEKLGLRDFKELGITDSGGVEIVYELAKYIMTISKLSKKLKALAAIIDSNEYSPNQRVHSFINSLKFIGANIIRLTDLRDNVYSFLMNGRKLIILVAGLLELPFKKHMIEDYVVKLLIEQGVLSLLQIVNYESAKDVLTSRGIDPLKVIRDAEEKEVKKVFQSFKVFYESIDAL